MSRGPARECSDDGCDTTSVSQSRGLSGSDGFRFRRRVKAISVVNRDKVVEEARKIVVCGKYTYKQVREDQDPNWKNDSFMDCSEFVYQSYQRAGFTTFPALNTSGIADDAKKNAAKEKGLVDKARNIQGGFFRVEKEDDVVPGDIVYWPGHVGIVEDPKEGTFLAAASTKSGLRRDNYKTGIYWSKRSGRTFIRYLPPPTPGTNPQGTP